MQNPETRSAWNNFQTLKTPTLIPLVSVKTITGFKLHPSNHNHHMEIYLDLTRETVALYHFTTTMIDIILSLENKLPNAI